MLPSAVRGTGRMESGESTGGGGRRRTPWLLLYATAMGLLEAAVVVYLRELFYPDGFRFPMVLLPPRIALVELVREATTLAMLLAVAALAARDRVDGFFVFALLFGVWDIVYYAGLRLALGWPASLLEWDVLFLIPVPWLAPVAYPLAISVLLIAGFVVHERLARTGGSLRPTVVEWASSSAGAVAIVVAFCWHWRAVSEQRVPQGFPLGLFLAGVAVACAPFLLAARRGSQNRLRTIS